jgi:SnoaL-like domain
LAQSAFVDEYDRAALVFGLFFNSGQRFCFHSRIFSSSRASLVLAWVDVFNQRDVDKLGALYSAAATNHQVLEGPVSGREAIRTMFKDAFALRCGILL